MPPLLRRGAGQSASPLIPVLAKPVPRTASTHTPARAGCGEAGDGAPTADIVPLREPRCLFFQLAGDPAASSSVIPSRGEPELNPGNETVIGLGLTYYSGPMLVDSARSRPQGWEPAPDDPPEGGAAELARPRPPKRTGPL